MTWQTLEWVGADGGTTLLTDLRGVTGRMMPPVRVQSEQVPGQPGTRLRSVLDDARQVVVPILVEGSSPADYRSQLRRLARALHPVRGEGLLRSVDAERVARELRCRYVDGFAGLEEYPTFATPSLLFRADDPYWYDAADTLLVVSAADAPTFFPFFPLSVSASEVFADVSVVNTGDVEAWPVWTIDGPADAGFVVVNSSSGKGFTIGEALAAGDQVTVDTRPGAKTVTRADGSNAFSVLTDDSSLWALPAGLSVVTVEITGATEDTSLVCRYRRRWLSA